MDDDSNIMVSSDDKMNMHGWILICTPMYNVY